MKKTKYPEFSDLKLPDEIELPFFIKPNADKSDALDDFYINFSHWLNYICEVLLFSHVEDNLPVGDFSIKPDLKYGIGGEKRIISPTISLKKSKKKIIAYSLAENLYNQAIALLVSNYEQFLNDQTSDILWRNPDILAIEERQLTTKQIFNLGNIDDIKEFLIEKKLLEHTMLSYPKRVDAFQRYFHVGIHSKKAPLSLEKVHDLIEVRNVVLHSGGYASPKYFERMSAHTKHGYKPLLKKELDTLNVDFVWIIGFAKSLLELAGYIDEEVAKKWKTTREIHKNL